MGYGLSFYEGKRKREGVGEKEGERKQRNEQFLLLLFLTFNLVLQVSPDSPALIAN
jgi:hypothetical protein